MNVYTVEGFSAHSDRKQLIAYVGNMEPKPNLIMTIHGEPSKCSELASAYRSLFRIPAKVPSVLDAVRLK